MATTDLSPIAGRTVRTPDGKNYRIPAGATQEQVSRFFATRSKAPDAAATPSASPMVGVVGGSSTATVAPRRAVAAVRAPINPYSRTEQQAPAPNPIVRGFTGTIYGGNVAGAGRTVKAAGQATGIPAIERAGQAIQAHGERFKGAPPPPDIFQIAPDDPAARQQVMDYLGYTLGSGLASTIPSVAGAVAGSAAVGAAAGPVGATAGAVRGGAIAGAALPAYLMNTGSVMEEIERITGGTEQGRARLALLIGLPVTGLDLITSVAFGGKIVKFMLRNAVADAAAPIAAKTGWWAAVKTGATGGLKGGLAEGGTEGTQNVVQDVGIAAGTDKKFDPAETARGAGSAFIGGGLTGGVLGFGTSVLPQGRTPAPAEEAQTLAVRPPPVPAQTMLGGAGPAISENLKDSIFEAARTGKHPAAGTDVAKWPAAERAARTAFLRGYTTRDEVVRAAYDPASLDRDFPAKATGGPAQAPAPAPTTQTPQAPKTAPAQAAGAPTAIQSRIAALETQVRKRPNEPKLRRRLEALKAEHQAKVGPEDEAHEALQAKIAGAPKRIAALEKQIAETPNDKRVGKWKARVEELRSLVATGKPKAKGAAGEAGAEPAPAKQTTAPDPVASSPLKVVSQAPKAPSAGAAPANTRGVEGSAAAPPQATPPAAEAPARTMVPNMQFGDEAAAKRVAVGIARNTPEAAPKVVKTKKGFEIEVNEDVGESRLKKQSFVKVAPKNPAPDVAAAAASVAAPEPAPVAREPRGNGPEGSGKGAAVKSEELARQGTPLKEAKEQAEARSDSDPPAGPGLEAPRGTMSLKDARYKASYDEGLKGEAFQKRVAELTGQPYPAGTRNYKPRETLIVPYTGRSKKLTSERGIFQGYVDVGGVPHVSVLVHHGMKGEIRTFPESQVRRRPKIDRRPASGRNPGMADKMRAEAGGDVEKAREMVKRAQAAFDRDEEAAKAAYEAKADDPKLRARMRKARDVLVVAKGIASELDPDFGFPSFLKVIEGEGDVSFNVDEIEKLPPWLGEEGFVNLADLRDAIRMAMRRISGIARRDPKLKRAIAKRPLRRSPEVELIIKALEEAGPVREAQSAEDTAERKRRMALSKTLEEGKEGFERIHARKASQKGELPPVHFESIAKALSYEQLKKLGNQIVNHPALSFYEVIQAGDALEKLLGERGGRIPEPAEQKLLELIFGPEFVDAIMKKRPQIMDWKRRGWLAIAVSRALRSSFDFGAALRQGLYLGSRFPKLWAKAFAAQHFHWWSKTAFEEDMEDIANDPLYIYARMGHLRSLRDERGAEKDDPLYKRENALSITRVGGRNLAQQEEAFLDAEFAEQMHEPIERAIPGMGGKVAAFPVRIVSSGVRRSNQAYVGFLNRLRFESFKELWKLARANGRDPATDVKLLKEICRYINASSGRGDSKFIDDHVQGMNAAFFSARLQKSRIELLNPRNYVKGDPFVRKQYWLQMRNASAGATVLLTLAAWMGAKVEWDSLNADWGKIRVGGVVYDVLGGLTQYLRLYPAIASAIWQQANGRRLKINGRPVTALALISRFVSHKLAPVPAVVYTWLEGYANSTEKKGGGRKKLHYSDIPKDLLFLFVPMLLEDFFEVWNSDPRWQVRAASIPASTYGVSVQSYDLQQQRLRIRAPQMPRMPSAPSMP